MLVSSPLAGLAALWLAQAEPAPPEPPPPPAIPTPIPPGRSILPPGAPAAEATARSDFGIAVGFGGERRLGQPPDVLGPTYGFAVTTEVGFIYARPAGLELSVGGGFAYQRFRDVVPLTLDGVAPTDATRGLEDERTFSYYLFEARQTLAVPFTFIRPFVTVGAGFGLAYFSTREPALAPGEKRATRPGLSATLGFDAPMGRKDTRIGIAFEFNALLAAPDLTTTGGRVVPLFGRRAGLRLMFVQPF